MKKIYIQPKSRFVSLEAESQLMSASFNADKSQLNSLSIDSEGTGGSEQLTNRQNSLWDNWSD